MVKSKAQSVRAKRLGPVRKLSNFSEAPCEQKERFNKRKNENQWSQGRRKNLKINCW